MSRKETLRNQPKRNPKYFDLEENCQDNIETSAVLDTNSLSLINTDTFVPSTSPDLYQATELHTIIESQDNPNNNNINVTSSPTSPILQTETPSMDNRPISPSHSHNENPDPMTLMLQHLTNLSAKFDEQKQDLMQKIDAQSTKLTNMSEQLNNKIIEEIHIINSHFQQAINTTRTELMTTIEDKNNETQTILIKHCDNNHAQLKTQVQSTLDIFQSNLITQQDNFKTMIHNDVHSQINNNKASMESLFKDHEAQIQHKLTSKTNQLIDHKYELLDHKLSHQTNLLLTQTSQHQQELNQLTDLTNKHATDIKENTQQLQQLHLQINNLPNQPINVSLTPNHDNLNRPNQPTIHVNCPGTNMSEHHLTLPRFNSKHRNPLEFLKQFNNYYEYYIKRRQHQDCLTYLELVEQCLEGYCANWFQIIKTDLKSPQDFQTKFTNTYWNRTIQQTLRRKIENEKYSETGKLSRTEYVLDRSLILKSMTPSFTENDIILILADNFNDTIRSSVRVQNIQSLEDFITLLSREDIESSSIRNRQNAQNNKSQPIPNIRNNNSSYYNQTTNRFNSRNNQYMSDNPQDRFDQYQTNSRSFNNHQPNYRNNFSSLNPHHRGSPNTTRPSNNQYYSSPKYSKDNTENYRHPDTRPELQDRNSTQKAYVRHVQIQPNDVRSNSSDLLHKPRWGYEKEQLLHDLRQCNRPNQSRERSQSTCEMTSNEHRRSFTTRPDSNRERVHHSELDLSYSHHQPVDIPSHSNRQSMSGNA